MNQKNYTEISGIINSVRIKCMHIKEVSNRLADYFEREEKEMDGKVKDGDFIPLHKNEEDYFNREQFLKDCGVKQ